MSFQDLTKSSVCLACTKHTDSSCGFQTIYRGGFKIISWWYRCGFQIYRGHFQTYRCGFQILLLWF